MIRHVRRRSARGRSSSGTGKGDAGNLRAALQSLAGPGAQHLALTTLEQHPARTGWATENTDGAAYADAVSEYAALGRDGLREAARALTSGRG